MADADDSTAVGEADLPDGTWSVARLNEEIAAVLDAASARFPTYVVGEIVDINAYDWGTFFTLSDLDEAATVSCLAWAHAIDGFDAELAEGISAVVQGQVDYHVDKGTCQLLVSDYWPVGESARVQDLAALRATLADEGLFDDDRKQPLPAFPSCIGVVTSLSGSAREDICSAIQSRAPGTTVMLCGATVQGENAVASVVGAVQRLDRDPAVDILVVTRGGGADTDLWCFNAEPLVRSVADAATPTIAAIGHEDDRTLTDDVADVRAMTPTDAGVKATPDMSTVRRSVAQLERRVHDAYRTHVADRLAGLARRVDAAHEALQQQLETRRERLHRTAALEARIDGAYETHVDRELDALAQRITAGGRELEADARVDAGTAEARRLRVVVAVLILVVLVLGVGIALVLLGLV